MDRLILALLALVLAALPAKAQTSCGTLSGCPTGSTPLSGAELLYMLQNGVSKKITASNFIGQNVLPFTNVWSGALNTFTNDVTVGGTTTLNNLTVGGTTTLNNFTVGGTTTLNNLTVGGTTTLNNFTVGGTTTLNNLTVGGTTALNNLTVGDTTTFRGEVLPYASFNVTGYGALCNGSTDDTAAIQLAITTAQSTGWAAEVIIPPSADGCLVQGTLAVTANNITIRGGPQEASGLASGLVAGGARLVFSNSAADDIDIGFQSAQVFNVSIKDLTLQGSGKTGGTAINTLNTASTTIKNVNLWSCYNGIWANRVNNMKIERANLECTVPGNLYGIQFVTTNSSISVRSDVLYITDTVIQMSHSGGNGMIVNGFSNDIHADHMTILGAGAPGGAAYGIWIKNDASAQQVPSGTSSYFPGYGLFSDLEIDGQYGTAIRIDGGDNWQFIQSAVNSVGDTNYLDPIVLINPDIGANGSATRQVYFVSSYISDGPGQCVNIGAKDSIFSGSTFADCGKYAGANGLGGARPPVSVIEVEGSTDGLVAVGNKIGYAFGQCCSGSNDYAVRVDAGANRVLLSANDYTLFNTTNGTILNGAGNGATIGNGINASGSSFGPTMTQFAGAGGANQYNLNNPYTSAGTQSVFSAGTGTSGAYILMGNTDGATPLGTLSSGVGDTGGLNVFTASGPLNLNPTGAVQVNGLAAVSCSGAPTGSFSVVKGIVTHC
jgi:hypothetical protein